MIDLIYKTLLTIINKENQGYISPTEFNFLANNVQNEIFRDYFEDENKYKNKKNRGLTNKGFSNLDFNQKQKISIFSENDIIYNVNNVFYLPNDLYFIQDNGVSCINLYDSKTVVIEEVEINVLNYLLSSISSPSNEYPIYVQFEDYISVYPKTILKIFLKYIRIPKKPLWTYRVLSNGLEIFDRTNNDFQDFELHKSEFSNIINRMLTYFGINLREKEVMQIAETLKDKLTIKER